MRSWGVGEGGLGGGGGVGDVIMVDVDGGDGGVGCCCGKRFIRWLLGTLVVGMEVGLGQAGVVYTWGWTSQVGM